MNDTLSDQAEELKSLPTLYKEIDKKKNKKILISRSGNESWDSFVNETINIIYPENKDDLLRQIPIKMSKRSFIFKPDESKKILYKEN